jgi:hypothetical protein
MWENRIISTDEVVYEMSVGRWKQRDKSGPTGSRSLCMPGPGALKGRMVRGKVRCGV